MSNLGILIPILALSIPIVAIIAHTIRDIVKHKNSSQQSSISAEEREQLERLMQTAEAMTERIATLESILDSEVPDWRDDHEQR